MASPYPQSTVFAGIVWDTATRRNLALGSDIWGNTWADDGKLYTCWGDGIGFGASSFQESFDSVERVTLGVSSINSGTPPGTLSTTNIWGGKNKVTAATFDGKSSGLICIAGDLYMFVSNEDVYTLGQMYKSTDKALSWTGTGFVFESPFDFMSICQFGQNYAGAIDNYVYFYTENASQSPVRDILLARCPKTELMTRASYQVFSGTQASPAWSSTFSNKTAIFTHNQTIPTFDVDPPGGSFGIVSVMYNPVFQRFILTVEHGSDGSFGVFDAPNPWGPWTTVAFYESEPFGTANQENKLNRHIPPKWLSADGLSFVCVYSGTGSTADGGDTWNTINGRFTLQDDGSGGGTVALQDHGSISTAVWPALSGDGYPITSKLAFSGMGYNPATRDVLHWLGGGHSATSHNGCFRWSYNNQTWTTLVSPTAYASQTSGNFDASKARFISDNKACSRHTYDQLVFCPNTNELVCMTSEDSLVSALNNGAFTGVIVHLHMGTLTQKYTIFNPYRYGSTAWDPVSGNVCTFSGVGNTFRFYNPVTGTWASNAIGTSFGMSYDHNMVYFPPTDQFFIFGGITVAGRVGVITPNRSNLNSSTAAIYMTGALYNGTNKGFAYDSANEVIAGGVTGQTIYTFDPRRSTKWVAITMSGATVPGGVSRHHHVYDQVANRHIFIASDGTTRKLMSVDLGSGGGTTPISISPSTPAAVASGATIQFTALNGSGTKTWSASIGTVTSAGLWTAPTVTSTTNGTVTVQDTTGSATANVQVTPAAATLAIVPTSASITVGTTLDFNFTGGVSPHTFSLATISGGTGTLNATTGLFTAHASTTGVNDITVTDSTTPTPQTATARVTINAAAGGGVLEPLYIGTLADEDAVKNLKGWTNYSLTETADNLQAYSATGTPANNPIHQGPECDQLWVMELMRQRCAAHPAALAYYTNRLIDWDSYFLSGNYRLSGEFDGDIGFLGDHIHGTGLVLRYRATGTASYLTEARAILNEVDLLYKGTTFNGPRPGGPGTWPTSINFGLNRAQGRQLWLACLVAESSGNGADITIRNNLITLYKNTSWDESRGTWFDTQYDTDNTLAGTFANKVPAGSSYAGGWRMISLIQSGWIITGLIQAIRVTNDAELKRRLIKMADFFMIHGAQPASSDSLGQFLTGSKFMLSPPPENARVDNWFSGSDVRYTAVPVNLFVWAWKLTGNQAYLDRADRHYIYENQVVDSNGTIPTQPPQYQRYMDMQFTTSSAGREPLFGGYSPFVGYLWQGGAARPAVVGTPSIPPAATITLTNGPNFTEGDDPTFTATATPVSPATITTGQFLRDGIVVATDNTSPYAGTDVDPPAGDYSYSFRVTDSNGQTGQSTGVQVTIVKAPTAVLTGPAQIAAGGNITLTATSNAGDPNGFVSLMELKESGSHVGGSPFTSGPFDTRQIVIVSPTTATHTYDLTVTGHAGVTATDPHVVSVIATNSAPSVVGFAADNLNVIVGNTINFTVEVTDTDAGQNNRIEILHDGSVIAQSGPQASGTSVDYLTSWTPQVAGTYILTPKAYDNFSPPASATGTPLTIVVSPATQIPTTTIELPAGQGVHNAVEAGQTFPLQASGADLEWIAIRYPKGTKFQSGTGPLFVVQVPTNAKDRELIKVVVRGADGRKKSVYLTVEFGTGTLSQF